MKYPILTEDERRQRLTPPRKKIKAVIDSDTYNEVDDQFAISYAMLSSDKIEVEAVYAAPFSSSFFSRLLQTDGVSIPMTGDLHEGLELSYQEILKLMDLLGKNDFKNRVFRGSNKYMTVKDQPVDSDAARDLVKRVHECDDVLYVIAIGEITNVASAILLDPEIIKKMVVVWLAGQPLYWPHAVEFNIGQDVLASQTILDSGVPLVLVPCMSVASYLSVTGPELEHHLKGKSKVGTYLCETVTKQMSQEMAQNWLDLFHQTYCAGLDDYRDNGVPTTDTMLSPSRIIWDISTVGYVINPNWCPSTLVPTPRLTQDLKWEQDEKRHEMRLVRFIYRDALLGDMFSKIQKAPK